MTKLNRAGDSGSLGDINITQGDIRTQFDAATDMLRQLGGNPAKGDPLTAPFQLFVNPVTGSDKFVGGSYVTTDDGTYESKMRRIELQRLECGYTASRPFKSLARACLEAAIITSKEYFDLTNPTPCGDLVSINLSTGVHVISNGEGKAVANITAWTDGMEPTAAELQEFNTHETTADKTTGGLILPRGCSVVSLDLRKTIIRPDYVPPSNADEVIGASTNRYSIFKTTGGNYVTGITFLDKEGENRSHHLLHCFEYASQAELNELYNKIATKFPSAAGINPSLCVARNSEWQVVGPQPANPSSAVDTVAGASPYVFNCSVRSDWGLCGVFADGAKNAGFRSWLCAQFTGISNQKDMRCWQVYNGTAWQNLTSNAPDSQAGDYTQFLQEDPNDLRTRIGREHFHIRGLNRAVIQEVSVFTIGHAQQHKAETGAELTITNSNSSFGGVCGLAEGFSSETQQFDEGWVVKSIRRPLNPLSKTQNIQRIQLGILQPESEGEVTWSTTNVLKLVDNLEASNLNENQPKLLTNQGYSLKKGDLIWIDNPAGPDYRATIRGNNPWNGKNEILIESGSLTPDVETVFENDPNGTSRPPYGFSVYIRRLKDVRTVEERRYTVDLEDPRKNNKPILRLPIRDYILQKAGGDYTDQYSAVTRSEISKSVDNTIRVELHFAKRPETEYAYDAAKYYRKGDAIIVDGKHLVALRETTGAFDSSYWAETFVHMPSDWGPQGPETNATPILIFDNDTDASSPDLGNTIADVENQYKSATDYEGLKWQLINWGRTVSNVDSWLVPQDKESNRDKDISSMGAAPVEMRRPSNVRMFSHSYEWPGYSSYSKALPKYQRGLSPQNQFTYYFTNSEGGICYLSGFNQEGFQVTSRGVEDLATGEVLSVADFGNPDRPLDIPTTINGNFTVNGEFTATDYKNLPKATVDKQREDNSGVVRGLAGEEQIQAVQEGSGSSDEDIEASPAITLAGLTYWKKYNKVVTEKITSSIIYVVPDDAVYKTNKSGPKYTHNGASARLAADPRRNSEDVLKTPPANIQTAVTFNKAIEYGNAIASAKSTVEYRLCNGPYYEKLTTPFNHVADIVGALDFFIKEDSNGKFDPSANKVADYEVASSTTPSIDVRNALIEVNGFIEDGKISPDLIEEKTEKWKFPVFATGLTIRVDRQPAAQGNKYRLKTEPRTMHMSEGGKIGGVVFLGFEDTYYTPIFNSIAELWPQNANWQIETTDPTKKQLYGQIMAALQTREDAEPTKGDNWRVDMFTSRENIAAAADIELRCIVIGAKAPTSGVTGFGERGPLIRTNANCGIQATGLYFLGNCRVTDEEIPVNKVSEDPKFVYGMMNISGLVDSYDPTDNGKLTGAQTISITMNPIRQVKDSSEPVNKNKKYNFDCNCWHFLNNAGKYPAEGANDGPFIQSIVGRFNQGSVLSVGGKSMWSRYQAVDDCYPGVAGRMGEIIGSEYTGRTGIKRADQKSRSLAVKFSEDGNAVSFVPAYSRNFTQNRTDNAFLVLANSGTLLKSATADETIPPGTAKKLDLDNLPDGTDEEKAIKKSVERFNMDIVEYGRGVDVSTSNSNNTPGNSFWM